MDLYRFYDIDGRLLYIGVSLHAAHRASQHRKGKDWWTDVANMEVEHLECTRAEAEALERQAIIDEEPLYNVVHNGQRPGGVLNDANLVWICADCGSLVRDGDGVIEIAWSERTRWLREHDDWKTEHPQPIDGHGIVNMSALLARPHPMRWVARHSVCDPDPDRSYYHFNVERCRTAFQLIEWTAHLAEKDWVVTESDWFTFIRAAVASRAREGL